MPLYVIERNLAEEIQQSAETDALVVAVNNDVGITWLLSFLTADKKKTYCVYEASGPEAIREAATRLGIPTDVIVEVSELRGLAQISGVAESA